jgi:hypothetical protein
VRLPLTIAVLLLAAPAFAQHDITQVEPAPADGAASTPIPTNRGMKKYDIPDLAGAQQAIGSQLIDGRLPRPLVDYVAQEASLHQRLSIFEGGLVVVNMTGASTIRKKLILPADALENYTKAVSVDALTKVDQRELAPPEFERRSLVRIYTPDGKYVERVFNPTKLLPTELNDCVSPLRDLLRAVSEDRYVTSTVTGYEPKEGDELVGDDQQVYRVVRIIPGSLVVELKCLDSPTTIYVQKTDLHLYFVGAKPR